MKYSKVFNMYNRAYKEAKSEYRNLTMETFLSNIHDYVNVEGNSDLFDVDVNTNIRILTGDSVKHFFIESDSLFNFLMETKTKGSGNIERLYTDNIGADVCVIHHTNKSYSSIVLHALGTSMDDRKLTSIKVTERQLAKEQDLMLILNTKTLEQYYEQSESSKKYADLILNFLMYINTFPESVVGGPPLEVKEDSGYTVKSDPSISINGTISPHFRRGHFRFLSSDRYKNKRGETIFVKPTFVKGEAKTVMELVV